MQTTLRTIALTALLIARPTYTLKMRPHLVTPSPEIENPLPEEVSQPEALPTPPTISAAPTPTPAPAFEPSRTQEAITTKVGETFTVSLDYNPTTGVAWFINIASLETSPIQYIKQEYVRNPNPSGLMGIGGQLVLSFKAVSQGPTLIRLSAQGFGGEVYRLHDVRVTIQQ